MKRATLILNERALRELKRIAADEGRTLSDVVDEVLRTGMAEREKTRRARPGKLKLPVFDTGVPHINIADRNQLYDLFDEVAQ